MSRFRIRAFHLVLSIIGLGALLSLAGCGTANDGLSENRYQLAHTQPGALQNPKAAPDRVSAPPSPFAHWAAVIVAGDSNGAGGGHSEAFDNARRDLATALTRAGFMPEHIAQFSSDPKDSDATSPALTTVDGVKGMLQRLLGVAGEGCLIYVTSHGNTQGIKFGEKLASPQEIAGLGDKTCGGRPTVMIMSACHSGVFIQPLSAPNRLVMSAARSDRSSFGCGTDNKYPYFDECMIENLPNAHDFVALTGQVKSCVTRMETAGHFAPPSEPQLSIGSVIGPMLEQDAFLKPPNTSVASTSVQADSASCASAAQPACPKKTP
ncbi:MAG: C13 family peptidase [Alphaproteobacteria bacterium]